MFDQTFDFSVHKLPEFKDHSLVTAQIYAPAAAQMKTALRQVCEVPKLSKRTQNDNPLPSQLSSKFSEAIAQNDVDRAFQYWSLEFERVSLQVSQLQGHARPIKQAAKRGNITFHEQRAHPKTCRQQASTLIGRKLWKAHCRIIEITKAQNGVRRDRTIDNLWEVLPYLSPIHAEEFSEAMQKRRAMIR